MSEVFLQEHFSDFLTQHALSKTAALARARVVLEVFFTLSGLSPDACSYLQLAPLGRISPSASQLDQDDQASEVVANNPKTRWILRNVPAGTFLANF